MTNFIRYPDWPERLAEFIESRRGTPFAWGSNDCGLFAADAVMAITGFDIASDIRGYRSKKDALRLISKAGGIRKMVYFLKEKNVSTAIRGDMILADIDGIESFGIVVGNGMWCGPSEYGLVFRPMNEAVMAWSI